MFRKIRSRVAIGILFVLATCLLSGTAYAVDDLDEILSRFDEVQATVHSLRAEFEETTTSVLLKAPIVSEGRFFMSKPDAIRWEYTAPEEMRFVIAEDRYTGYFPGRKRAETRDIRRWSDQIFRFFGLGQGSAELAKFYNIRFVADGNEVDGTYLLVLEPRKRRVRKRVENVRFWLDSTSFLPRKIEYQSKDGNVRQVRFRNVRVNPDFAAGLFTVEIPSDVTVTQGFSGLPSFSPGATR